MHRIHFFADEFAIARKRTEESPRHIEKRDVVISWNDQLRLGEALEECLGLGELAAPGALREIAANHDQCGSKRLQVRHEPFSDAGYHGAKMEIRYVRD